MTDSTGLGLVISALGIFIGACRVSYGIGHSRGYKARDDKSFDCECCGGEKDSRW